MDKLMMETRQGPPVNGTVKARQQTESRRPGEWGGRNKQGDDGEVREREADMKTACWRGEGEEEEEEGCVWEGGSRGGETCIITIKAE
ncbi:hypothetical protein E2C01_094615 [Portunus trituberculatus]|uniref:Uncharacterized protein n=1 Tax=Portunus trituberculatus TaxID=210409 RepID=A0A5B7JXB9_PORTR|nr:hypothetical protein [Portunus trituberculatus]